MDLFLSLANNFLILLDAFSVYIIIGLFIAGILKQVVPADFVSSHLGRDSTSSVIKATLFGIPLPVCSCSVIPLAQGLRKEGASKGAVQSFLISTPITGVDSILATFSLFGLVFTTFRVISSIIIAILVGLTQNFFEKNDENETVPPVQTSSCCSSKPSKKFSLIEVFKYGYGTLMEDMAKSLLIGLILGAMFITFMPEEYSRLLFDNQILTYFVVLLFAMPLYTCATASLPIAAALMLQGMSGGAAFIFLTAGPATSAVTMSIVYKMLGKKSLIIYLSVIAILALIFGFSYDLFFDELTLLKIASDNMESSLINSLSSFLMLLLIIYHIIKGRMKNKETQSCCSSDSTIKNENNTEKNACSSSFSTKPTSSTSFKLKP